MRAEVRAYDLEAWAFSLEGTREERADAFDVVADAFEDEGVPGAETRRSWARTLRRGPRDVDGELARKLDLLVGSMARFCIDRGVFADIATREEFATTTSVSVPVRLGVRGPRP